MAECQTWLYLAAVSWYEDRYISKQEQAPSKPAVYQNRNVGLTFHASRHSTAGIHETEPKGGVASKEVLVSCKAGDPVKES